ncbi:MAG: ankyrin repeat domain-containing protein [Bacteroidales bacterium]|nr:ankyrin repeat domain-containing protein [Bacteroidales bacterium]
MIVLLLSLGASFDHFPIASFVGGSDNPGLTEFLIENGLNLNIIDKETGRNSLHFAAMYGYENTSRMLLKKKININHRDNWGNTPLDLAKKNNHYNVYSIIKQHNIF